MIFGESWRAQGGRRNKNLFQSRVNTGKGDFTTKESLTSAHIFKPTETFQYTYFSSCNPHGVRKGLIKGEAIRLLRTNSSAKSFYENNFKKRLRARGYSHNLIEKITSEVKFTERKSALQKNNEVRKKNLPFVTTYHPALQNPKNILMSKWHLIQDQPLLRVRGVSQIKFTMSDSFFVFYDFDILSMIKRKNSFGFYCVILILNLSRLISQMHFWFPKFDAFDF